MNGQTGKFVGNLPVDKKLYWTYFVVLSLIIGTVIYAAMWIFVIL